MTLFDNLKVNPKQGITLAHQLKQQITWMITNGQLPAGSRLPSVQEMAKRLGINLHTVRSAYHQLESEGLVDSRQGRGTHVLPFDLAHFAQVVSNLRSHTIGVILPSWQNPFYHLFLQGVEEIAEADQTLFFIGNTHDDPQAAFQQLARFSARQVDGVLVVAHDVSSIFKTGEKESVRSDPLPIVTVDWPSSSGCRVLVDLEDAGTQATRHLVSHGHRRIGLITFAHDLANVVPINHGYQQVLVESGLTPDPAYQVRVPGFDLASGYEGARRLLSLPKPPSAIFAIADMLALGAMKAIKDSGLRIPHDIALTSFNDIPLATLVDPPLTTVAAPAVELGRESMRRLRQLIDGKPIDQSQVMLTVQLVVRQSCGC